MANIAFRVGGTLDGERSQELGRHSEQLADVIKEFEHVLGAHQLQAAAVMRVSPLLNFDAAAEQFTGDGAEAANSHLTREFRAPYAAPQFEDSGVQSAQAS